jgi:histidyl-tRNA synthetase
MSLSTQPYKGARDFYPEDKRLQKYVFSVMRKVAESFGYLEYDAPILEYTELYMSKGSDEIINEQTYTFTDRGERSVTIRTEMTPSVSRMVAARRQELNYPARWYSIPNLWRYERPQRGRLREFWQLNVDIFGVAGVEADHEIIQVADAIMKGYGAKRSMYTIKVNSRKMVNYVLADFLGMNETGATALIRLIDRMHKMPHAEFIGLAEALLTPKQRDVGVMQKLLQVLESKRIVELPIEVQNHPSVLQLQVLLDMLASSGMSNVKFDVSLMRGFDYYTDIVFEVFDTDPANNRAMFGGGRYDGLVSVFGVEPVPTVGFGMGDVTLVNFLESHDLMPNLLPETDLIVLTIGQDMYAKTQKLLKELRSEGLNVAIDSSDRKFDKQLKAAIKSGVTYVLFVGENELTEGRYKLKNLLTGVEETHTLERIVSIVAAS